MKFFFFLFLINGESNEKALELEKYMEENYGSISIKQNIDNYTYYVFYRQNHWTMIKVDNNYNIVTLEKNKRITINEKQSYRPTYKYTLPFNFNNLKSYFNAKITFINMENLVQDFANDKFNILDILGKYFRELL